MMARFKLAQFQRKQKMFMRPDCQVSKLTAFSRTWEDERVESPHLCWWALDILFPSKVEKTCWDTARDMPCSKMTSAQDNKHHHLPCSDACIWYPPLLLGPNINIIIMGWGKKRERSPVCLRENKLKSAYFFLKLKLWVPLFFLCNVWFWAENFWLLQFSSLN